MPPARVDKIRHEKNVVVFRQGSIGDFVISLPCLHAIRKSYPCARITLLTNQPENRATVPAESILDGTQLVDDYLGYRGGTRNFWELIELRRALRKLAPEILVYLAEPRGEFAAHRDYFFFRSCGIKNVIGLPTTSDMQNCRAPLPGSALWESEAARLARTLGLPFKIAVEKSENWNLNLSTAEIEAAKRLLHESVLSDQYGKTRLLGLSIGTNQEINNWGSRNWRAVLSGLKRFNLGLIIIGGADDREPSQALADEWHGPALNLCGKISPRLSAAVIQNAVLFLCHDSGPMHLAASVGTKCVAVFSRRNPPGQWFPFGNNHRILYPRLETDRITSIEPSQVIAAAVEILGELGEHSNLVSDVAPAPECRPQVVVRESR